MNRTYTCRIQYDLLAPKVRGIRGMRAPFYVSLMDTVAVGACIGDATGFIYQADAVEWARKYCRALFNEGFAIDIEWAPTAYPGE